jgi:hypothetical protein
LFRRKVEMNKSSIVGAASKKARCDSQQDRRESERRKGTEMNNRSSIRAEEQEYDEYTYDDS